MVEINYLMNGETKSGKVCASDLEHKTADTLIEVVTKDGLKLIPINTIIVD